MDLATTFHTVSAFFEHNSDLLTISAGAVAGALALSRYWADQAWKKKQFAYDYANRVFEDRQAMAALHMIDWSNGDIPKDIAAEYDLDPDHRFWDQAEVARALRPHDEDPEDATLGGFSPKEYVIRELFDRCLAHFERLGHFLKSGIISRDDFPTSLAYYIHVTQEDRLQPLADQLARYLDRYGFENVRYLFRELR